MQSLPVILDTKKKLNTHLKILFAVMTCVQERNIQVDMTEGKMDKAQMLTYIQQGDLSLIDRLRLTAGYLFTQQSLGTISTTSQDMNEVAQAMQDVLEKGRAEKMAREGGGGGEEGGDGARERGREGQRGSQGESKSWSDERMGRQYKYT